MAEIMTCMELLSRSSFTCFLYCPCIRQCTYNQLSKKKLFIGFELFLLYHHLSNQSSWVYFKRRFFDLISDLTPRSSEYRIGGVHHILFSLSSVISFSMRTDSHLINLDALIFCYLLCKLLINSYLYCIMLKKSFSLNSIHPKMMNGMQGNINCISY